MTTRSKSIAVVLGALLWSVSGVAHEVLLDAPTATLAWTVPRATVEPAAPRPAATWRPVVASAPRL